jgi:TRAP-type C4-dicarboxylate transport system permease small subunit
MAGIAVVVLLVCAAAILAVVEFLYRYLFAAPIAWLLTRLGRLSAAWRG